MVLIVPSKLSIKSLFFGVLLRQPLITYTLHQLSSVGIRSAHEKMMECCQDRLAAELEIVKPTVIICVGKAPAIIFGLSDKITKLKMGVTEVKKCPGQSSWGYSPKLIVTDPLTKIAEDVKLQNDFISAFNKAERFKDPGSGLESGIKTYAMFDNPKELDEWVTKVGNTEKDILVAADIESTGLKWFAPNARIRTIAVSWFHGYSYCIPFEEDPEGYRPIVKKLLHSQIYTSSSQTQDSMPICSRLTIFTLRTL